MSELEPKINMLGMAHAAMDGPTTTEAADLLGLQPSDARVLGHLQRHGLRSVAEVARSLGLHRAQAHRSLTRLESRGAVDVMAGRPILYQAVPLGELLQGRMAELQTEQARIASLIAHGAVPVTPAAAATEGSGLVRLAGQRAITSAVARIVSQARSSMVVRHEPRLTANDLQEELSSAAYATLGDRGVQVRALVSLDEDAVPLLPDWAAVRPAPGGDHLRYVVVDGRCSVLWTDPEVTADSRCAILTDARPVAMLLLDDFERAWSGAWPSAWPASNART